MCVCVCWCWLWKRRENKGANCSRIIIERGLRVAIKQMRYRLGFGSQSRLSRPLGYRTIRRGSIETTKYQNKISESQLLGSLLIIRNGTWEIIQIVTQKHYRCAPAKTLRMWWGVGSQHMCTSTESKVHLRPNTKRDDWVFVTVAKSASSSSPSCDSEIITSSLFERVRFASEFQWITSGSAKRFAWNDLSMYCVNASILTFHVRPKKNR